MAELGLAGLATADLAIKYGKVLIQLCVDFRHADEEVRERFKKIKTVWIRTERQIDFLGRVWDSLDVDLQEHQSELLDELASKLDAAGKQLERVLSKTDDGKGPVKVNRMKYAAIKSSIDRAIEQLREWQRDFDPGWFLTMKIAKPVIDRELSEDLDTDATAIKVDESSEADTLSTARKMRGYLNDDPGDKFEVFRKSDDTAQQEPIPYSAAKLMRRTGKGGTRYYMIDTVPCIQGVSVDSLTKDIRELARKLSVADPITFGLLQCRGVVKKYGSEGRKPTAFDFIFQIPPTLHSPRSLRHMLLTANPNASLSDRFRVARQLAQSVSYIHTYDFVHKSIRPDTILVLQDAKTDLAASFLIGFEKFRTADGRTLKTGDSVWHKDLYRHPQRQDLNPEDAYIMQHDIYSLGVCLLEIGMWKSFVEFEDADNATPMEWIGQYVHGEDQGRAIRLKEHLVGLAQEGLPGKMGDKYSEVVVNCLTCLDESNEDFGDPEEFEDEDGVQIGVRYIEKILRKLNSISI
ncbi:hypothetical protein BU23DRAFT_560927 [Bimuria novae-zelandiae CBS 107.79]|uniref:Protein kinase domain-containing protein n=1 Tax=Bimuria novae-zelandiae CBS 107.79 TaxID=1447943 RepID=A0A6A5UP42_9PLEO|nr:hypothetical protein BU23DRAFT_560927 [Bimuria novae-zelandiae CBS 107.79]